MAQKIVEHEFLYWCSIQYKIDRYVSEWCLLQIKCVQIKSQDHFYLQHA